MKDKIPIIFFVIAFLIELSRRFVSDDQNLFYLASISVSLGGIAIRFLMDKEWISERFKGDISGIRYVTYMMVAVILCTIADFLLQMDFIIGMITFLIAHILYILAFLGIIDIRAILEKGWKQVYVLVGIILYLLVILIYFVFIYNPQDVITLVVIPYVLILSTMVVITFFGLNYTTRAPLFKWLLVIGSLLFLFSDTILAINKFSTPILESKYIIGDTYILALIGLQSAVLFSKDQNR